MSQAGERRIVIMKFGGTSVATPAGREAIAARVTEALELEQSPIVVVSAMGRKGEPYATDTLLGLLAELPPDERERDLLSSVGEIISAVIVAHELRAGGINARAYTGPEAGIGTDGVHGASSITEIHTGPLVSAVSDGIVPVVCGFQGISDDGRVTTLGRGGSDTTACALGVALNAEEVAIYTDVDGVMTADPRSCDGAEVLETVGADELFQMAMHGTKVVHTPAAELALASGLSVRVRNTYSSHPGTSVIADISGYKSPVATAVSQSQPVARFTVALGAPSATLEHTTAQSTVYSAMADAGLSLDMFTPLGESLVFSLAQTDAPRGEEVLRALGLTYRCEQGLVKVTLVGAGMHGVPGVMAKVAHHLAQGGVEILQVADSHTTISVLVSADDASAAVQALHDGFELGA